MRFIRNELEKRGFEPLMFYLKCLNDEDEIEDLIKREINERNWFIYVESKNSINSKWVPTEREYIKSLKGKKVFTIDINKSINEQLERIETISRQMKIFISYLNKDKKIYNEIKNHLVYNDLLVLSESDYEEGIYWSLNIGKQLEESSHNGFVIVIITKNSINSKYMESEIMTAQDHNAKIIPVIVGNLDYSILKQLHLARYQVLKISENVTKEELDNLYNIIVKTMDN